MVEYNLNLIQKQLISHRNMVSLNILKMSSADLTSHIEKVVCENPVLEIDYSGDQNAVNTQKNFINQYPSGYEENFTGEEKFLTDELILQLGSLKISKSLYQSIYYLIHSLDENGYLQKNFGENDPLYESALALLHKMQPYGVGARNLKECLIIQAEQLNICTPVIQAVINKYLQDVAKKNYRKIAIELGISIKQVLETVDMILKLNPKPGNGYYSRGSKRDFIHPDIYIYNNGGTLIVVADDRCYPQLSINEYYRELIHDAQAGAYIRSHLNEAIILMNALKRRNDTLLQCARQIVMIQKGFFMHEGDLKPYTLSELAVSLNLNVSTISRAIAGKYVQWNRQIFPLYYFFSAKNRFNAEISQQKILGMLSEIIKNENKMKPFSDEMLSQILDKKFCIRVSRRTVTKYRKILNISSSEKRKCR